MSIKVSVIIPAYNMEFYLQETLDSLVNQSLEDLEVIMVNDGSTDGTQEIMEEYQTHHPHFRLISQSNKGTSAAKNRGMSEARGEYLAFLDGDDLFTPLALEKMYTCAQKRGADLVVGRTQTFSRFGKSYYPETVQLSRREVIEPFDLTLVWSFSQSNKFFLREKVRELDLRFPDKKYAEDGIFVLDFAHHADMITGCPHDVLLYRRRVLGEDYSATQTITPLMIEEYLEAYQEIIHLSQQNHQERYGTPGGDYVEEIRYKECKLFLDQFYRHFWRIKEEDLKYLKEAFLTLKGELSPESWQRLSRECSDLGIEDLEIDKKYLARHPFLSLVIHSPHNEKWELMLDSVYAQDNPSFEVLSFQDSGKYREQENFRVLEEGDDWKAQALEEARGDYLWFLDDTLILGPRAIRNFYQNSEGMDMVTAPLSQLDKEDYPSQELVYLYRYTRQPNHHSPLNLMDLYLTNKILRKDFLRGEFRFTKDTPRDVHRLYQETQFQKVHQHNLYSFKEEAELLKSLRSQDRALRAKISLTLSSRRIVYPGIKLKRNQN